MLEPHSNPKRKKDEKRENQRGNAPANRGRTHWGGLGGFGGFGEASYKPRKKALGGEARPVSQKKKASNLFLRGKVPAAGRTKKERTSF